MSRVRRPSERWVPRGAKFVPSALAKTAAEPAGHGEKAQSHALLEGPHAMVKSGRSIAEIRDLGCQRRSLLLARCNLGSLRAKRGVEVREVSLELLDPTIQLVQSRLERCLRDL